MSKTTFGVIVGNRGFFPDELAKDGLPKKTIDRIIAMVDRNEYKRRQSPPGIKITPKAFGKDRRMPITNLYTSKGFNGGVLP